MESYVSIHFWTQLKTVFNILQHCLMYLFGFFKTHLDQAILVPLDVIGFDGLMVLEKVTGFVKLAVPDCQI